MFITLSPEKSTLTTDRLGTQTFLYKATCLNMKPSRNHWKPYMVLASPRDVSKMSERVGAEEEVQILRVG